jgi:hypothetical protein
MRAMMVVAAMMAAALWAGPAAAQTGFQDVPGGKKHVRTGITCPAAAGKLKLADVNDNPGEVFIKFNCIYQYDCGAAECVDEDARATLIGAPTLAVIKDWRGEMESNGFARSDQKAPNWGAEFAPETLRQTIDGKPATAALWSLGDIGKSMALSGMYAEKAAPSVEALVRKVQELNPRKGQ